MELKNQLILLAGQENLNDQDRKQIERLMEEIDGFMNSKMVELNDLTVAGGDNSKGNNKVEMVKNQPYSRFNLNAKYNIKSITEQIQKI